MAELPSIESSFLVTYITAGVQIRYCLEFIGFVLDSELKLGKAYSLIILLGFCLCLVYPFSSTSSEISYFQCKAALLALICAIICSNFCRFAAIRSLPQFAPYMTNLLQDSSIFQGLALKFVFFLDVSLITTRQIPSFVSLKREGETSYLSVLQLFSFLFFP